MDKAIPSPDVPTKSLPATFKNILINNLLSLEGISVFIVDIVPGGDFRYFYLNPEHQEKVGGKTILVSGKRPEDVLSPEEASTVRKHYNDCIASQKPISYEEVLTFQGKKTWWATHLQPRINATGEVIQIIGTSSEITAYKEQEEHLRRTSAMEEMVSEISTDFINLPTDSIDAGIDQTLETIGNHVGADRSYLYVYDYTNKQLTNTHEWCNEGIKSEIETFQHAPIQDFPWINLQILGGLTVHIPSVKDLPDDAIHEREVFSDHGILSMINVPITQGKQIYGFIGFDAIRKQITWDEDTILMMRLVGQIISNALMRKEVDLVVMHSKELLLSTQQLAGVASFEVTTLDNKIVWSDNANEVFLASKEEMPVTVGQLAKFFTPQFEEKVTSAVIKPVEGGSESDIEIQLARNGSILHFLFRTKAVLDTKGGHIRTIGSFLDITHRVDIENVLNHQLVMEKMLTDISNRFNRTSPFELFEHIQWTLMQICSSSHVENGFVVLVKPHTNIIEKGYLYDYQSSFILELNSEQSPREPNKWFTDILNAGDIIRVDNVDELPSDAIRSIEYFLKRKIRSLLVFPLFTTGELLGFIGFSSRVQFRTWTDDDVWYMKFLAEILTSGIARINALKELQDNFARYQTIYQNSPVAIWEEDFSKAKKYISEIKESGVKDLRKWGKKNPQRVSEIITSIKVIAVNIDINPITESKRPIDFTDHLVIKDLQENLDKFIEEIVAIDEDKHQFFVENLYDSVYTDNPIFTNLYWSVVPGSEQSWDRVIVSTVNVTRQVESERHLRESEERLRMVLDSAEDIILMQDINGKYLYYNAVPAYRDQNENVIGKYPEDIYTPENAKEIRQNLNKVVSSRRTLVTEIQIDHDGQSFWFSDVVYPIFSSDGNLVAVGTIGRNITKRKQAEAELVNTQNQLSDRVEELEKRNQELILLSEMLTMLQYSKDLEEGFIVVGQYLRQLFSGGSGSLMAFNESEDRLTIPSTWGKVTNPPVDYTGSDCWAIRRAKPYLVENTRSGIVCKHISDRIIPESTYCLPIIIDSEPVGAIHLESNSTDTGIPANTRHLAEATVEQISLAFTNIHLRHSLRMQAIHDPLTGLYNRLYLEENLSRELSRLDRSGQPLSLVIMDLDDLKDVNDTYGHPAGDAVLKEVARLLKHSVRVSDLPCRYGGDEFVLVLPDTNLEAAIKRAEQIRFELEQTKVEFDGQTLGGHTLSIGVACSPEHGHSSQDLISAADRALYAAKEQGKNRVCAARSNLE